MFFELLKICCFAIKKFWWSWSRVQLSSRLWNLLLWLWFKWKITARSQCQPCSFESTAAGAEFLGLEFRFRFLRFSEPEIKLCFEISRLRKLWGNCNFCSNIMLLISISYNLQKKTADWIFTSSRFFSFWKGRVLEGNMPLPGGFVFLVTAFLWLLQFWVFSLIVWDEAYFG